MATYVFGDLQGCYVELKQLLNKLHYNPSVDRLGFVGDLVNRGPDSLATLRFIRSLENPIVVLGNHDVYLLALALDPSLYCSSPQLAEVLQAPDCDELIAWLRQQPLLYHDTRHHSVFVHAGIPPQWSLEQAKQFALEVETLIQSDDFPKMVSHLFGDQPEHWHDQLSTLDRYRYILNAFTRMRCCDQQGKLDLQYKGTADGCAPGLKPWFTWPSRVNEKIIFGHWAAINGETHTQGMEALDTGCAWGNRLTAYCLETGERTSVAARTL